MIGMNRKEPAISQQQQTCQVSSYAQLGANPKDSIAIPHPVKKNKPSDSVICMIKFRKFYNNKA